MTVGIIVPTYNSAAFLSRALESIAAQERLPNEVLLVDDGSTDDTVAISAAWAAQQPFAVRLLENSTPHDAVAGRGPAAGRQTALHAATSDLIALLDHDDEMFPSHIRRTAGAMEHHAHVSLCFGDAYERFADGNEHRLLTESAIPTLPFDHGADGVRIVRGPLIQAMVGGSRIATAANMWRRDLALAVGGFDVRAGTCDDWLFFVLLSMRGDVAYLPEPIARKYSHGDNLSHARHRSRLSHNFFSALTLFLESQASDRLAPAHRAQLSRRREEIARGMFYEASRSGLSAVRTCEALLPDDFHPAWRDWLRGVLATLGLFRSHTSVE